MNAVDQLEYLAGFSHVFKIRMKQAWGEGYNNLSLSVVYIAASCGTLAMHYMLEARLNSHPPKRAFLNFIPLDQALTIFATAEHIACRAARKISFNALRAMSRSDPASSE